MLSGQGQRTRCDDQATGWTAQSPNRGRGKRLFLLVQNVQTGSGSHRASG
jgi:hypothetical protein